MLFVVQRALTGEGFAAAQLCPPGGHVFDAVGGFQAGDHALSPEGLTRGDSGGLRDTRFGCQPVHEKGDPLPSLQDFERYARTRWAVAIRVEFPRELSTEAARRVAAYAV